MRRREFIVRLGSAAAAWPLAVQAQQAVVPKLGFLFAGAPDSPLERAFLKGLAEAGYVDGRNLSIEFRWADNRYDRLPAMAAELVSLPVSVIYAGPTPAAFAAKQATTTIPIVFTTGFDPVRVGLVASLNRPDGNLTGITYFTGLLGAKKLDIVRQIVPNSMTIAVLVNPTNPIFGTDASELIDLQAAARALGSKLIVVEAATDNELDRVFASLAQQQVGAVIVTADQFFTDRSAWVTALAARDAIPAMYESRRFTEDGGLVSYGCDLLDQNRVAGTYAGRILKGEKPSGLPVVQPAKFEFLINLRTAKTLGLEIPPGLLALANEVIE